MKKIMTSRYLLTCCIHVLLCCFYISAGAQKITGTWEGVMDDEILQVNIRQEGNKACGYTYDYIIGQKANFCRAYFEGYYDRKMEYWVLNGTGFYENRGNHVLMRMVLWLDKTSKPYKLRGSVGIKDQYSAIFGMSSAIPVRLSKVSSTPNKIPGSESPCFEPVPKPNPEPSPRQTAPKPTPPITKKPDSPQKKQAPQKPEVKVPPAKDSIAVLPKTAPDVRDIKPAETIKPELKILSRKNREMKRLVVNTEEINLKLFDNGVVDNDTVSIYYNGKLLVNRQKLSENPINLDIKLDKQAKEHRITMYAENLGTIPPNTALMVVTAGKNRYELFASASLEENAVLVFQYEPD